MKLLNDRIEELFSETKEVIEWLNGEADAEALDNLEETLGNLRRAIKDALVDAYIEGSRGERK